MKKMAPSLSTPMKFLALSMFFISIIYQDNAQFPTPNPNQTTMVFYLQDLAAGPNATVVAPVAGINGRVWSFTTFGSIFVVDFPVTLSISPTSELVGQAQGLLVASALDGASVNVALSIVFNNLQYNGSTLELQGISRRHENYREVSVVSGTGKFRFARGYAVLETAFFDISRSTLRLTITIQTN
ncbi:dirigent protein 22-like [Glycine soja]|uniref:Dirigent protein n=1 Tax=Glycine soja TaxID=3848 RepID=A0A445KGC9_GLYSO|nr:dirigent protein 22-like [Glycine soja]RZC09858.1 Dirigent protein 23 [Glycine soja]